MGLSAFKIFAKLSEAFSGMCACDSCTGKRCALLWGCLLILNILP